MKAKSKSTTRLGLLLAALILPLPATLIAQEETPADDDAQAETQAPHEPAFQAVAQIVEDANDQGLAQATYDIAFQAVADADADAANTTNAAPAADITVTAAGAQDLIAPVVLQLADQAVLMDKGPHGFLGVATARPSRDLIDHLGIPKNTGIVVATVAPDSPAAKAGLKVGDVLTKLDDQILVNPEQMQVLVGNRKEGDVVKVSYIRHGEAKVLEAPLTQREEPVAATAVPAPADAAKAGVMTYRAAALGGSGAPVPGTPGAPGIFGGTGGIIGGTVGGGGAFGGVGGAAAGGYGMAAPGDVIELRTDPTASGKPLRTIVKRLKFEGQQAQDEAAQALDMIRKELETNNIQLRKQAAKFARDTEAERERLQAQLRVLTHQLKDLDAQRDAMEEAKRAEEDAKRAEGGAKPEAPEHR